MSRITATFRKLARQGEQAFIPFLMAGDPDLETSKELVIEAEQQGADIIELGIPYSTPLADGPTIKEAGRRSLKQGTNLHDIFTLVTKIREDSQIPLILMGYYNPIFNYGVEEFVRDCEAKGVEGVIIPDLPVGEDDKLRRAASELDIISLVAPTSTDDRIRKVADKAQGFIYAVSTLGTTGAREEVSRQVEEVVSRVRELTSTPVAVGFGISRPQHVEEIAQFAEGIIVGSAIINKIAANLSDRDKLISETGKLIHQLQAPLRN